VTTSFAYIHCKPDGTPFYVGKGALRRVKYLGERNPHHQAVVKKHGKENILIGMFDCSSSSIAYDLERGLIKCLKRSGVQLTNFTDGGEGGVNPTLETRQRLSIAAKKRGVSEACHIAKVASKKGKSLSDEHKTKVANSMKGIVFSEEHKANIRVSAKKRGMSKETQEKGWAASRGRVQSLEEKEKRNLGIKKSLVNNGKTTKVFVNDVLYLSLADAAKAINVTPSGVLYGLKHSGMIKGNKVQIVL
jgi:hypothetical protein